MRISKIFDWFEDDFEAAGGVVLFVAAHVDMENAEWLRSNRDELRVSYFDYDWKLNGKQPAAAH